MLDKYVAKNEDVDWLNIKKNACSAEKHEHNSKNFGTWSNELVQSLEKEKVGEKPIKFRPEMSLSFHFFKLFETIQKHCYFMLMMVDTLLIFQHYLYSYAKNTSVLTYTI